MQADPEKTNRFIVQHFNEEAGTWLSINDRVFVRDHIKPGVPKGEAVKRAQLEAEKQVSGWQAAYPLRQYRAIPSESYY